MKNKQPYQRRFSANSVRPLSRSEVVKIIRAIWDEHSSRTTRKVSPDDGSDTKNESAKNFLRREIYALGRRIRSAPLSWDADALFEEMGRTTTRPDALENLFHALLFCVYESEQGITRQDRSLMSKELEYAYRHRVPPELLCGFLYQSTDRRRLSDRLTAGFTEPAFRSA